MIDGEWKKEKVQLSPATYFVPIKQAKGRVVLQLFEPKAKDSFLAWGFMNRFFEQKEYMENYVIDDVAQEMLKDPVVKKEFEGKLNEKDFASSPQKRFEFFYKKHPSYDQKYFRYPIFRK